jgi:glutamate-1-semialdehyde 2,1-aminomutase
MTLFFNPEPVSNWTTASRCDTRTFAKFFWGMLERGVYLPCSQFEALFVSAAHEEDDIDATIDAATEALAAIA